MGYLTEKVAYLKGLADGMKIDDSTNEGKLLVNILEVLDELALNLEDLNEEVIESEARIDELEEISADLMDELDDCDCDDCDCDCEYDEDEEDLDFYEVECPNCKEKVYFDEDMLDDDELFCPNCGEKIEIEFECDCDCEDCDCDCE